MGLPPNDVLLAPPRRSVGPLEWSRAHDERDCLRNLPASKYDKQRPRRALSPLKASRRNQAYHVALCTVPDRQLEKPRGCIHAQPSTVPIPLSARQVRDLSHNHAEKMRME